MPIILDRAITSPPSHTSFETRTILHWAVAHDISLLRKLLQRPKVDTILNVPDRHGATPLHSAVFYLCQDMLELLINKGANVNAKMGDELGDGWTPLHCASFGGQGAHVMSLLGANTEARTRLGHDGRDYERSYGCGEDGD